MKTLKIERYEVMGDGTRSRVLLPSGDMLHGLERSWRGNKPNVSCIPDGVYAIVPHISPHFQECYALIGGTVGIEPGQGKRWGCLIHPANYPHELSGCLAIGLRRDVRNEEPIIWSSRDACKILAEDLGNEPAVAVISWA